MKILIAEDEKISRKILETVLTDEEHSVTSVEDGLKALDAIKKDAPEILITDWQMPHLDGLELCRRVRELDLPSYIYIILWTKFDELENLVLGLVAGADDYITKPYQRAELLARIKAGERVIHLERSLRQRNEELSESLAQVKRLEGLLPICMYCKKIRNDQDYWEQIEDYIAQRSEAGFTHGICPECIEKNKERVSKAKSSKT